LKLKIKAVSLNGKPLMRRRSSEKDELGTFNFGISLGEIQDSRTGWDPPS